MGKGSSAIPVADYHLTIHYGVCYGVFEQVNQIYIKELPVWCGRMTEPGSITVDLPELFGGDTSEGGPKGVMEVYFGTPDQIMTEATAAQYDLTPTTMPGYRNVASVMFRGATSEEGFKWITNNPYVPGAWINGTRIPKQLSEDFAIIYPNGRDYEDSVSDTVAYNTVTDRNPVAMGATVEDIDAGLVTIAYSVSGSSVSVPGGVPLSLSVMIEVRFFDVNDDEIPFTAVSQGGIVDGAGEEILSMALPSGTRLYEIELTALPTFPLGSSTTREQTGLLSFPSNGPSWCEIDGSLASLPQANPAHMIYEALTDTDLGMGTTRETIDLDSFMYSAELFYNENFGLTAFWGDQTEVEDYISQITGHVQAALHLSPKTGLWTLVPFRDDYDVETLTVIDESNCRLENNGRKGLGETINEVVIGWTNPDTEETETITFQDPANIAAQGSLVSETHTYYMLRSVELANEVGARDIRTAAYPLFGSDAYVNRSLRNSVFPGAVLKLNWTADGITGMPVRVTDVDYGKPGAEEIKLSISEDIFGLEKTTYSTIQKTFWQDDSLVPPTPMTDVDFMTAPLALYLRAGHSLTELSDDDYPVVPVVVLAKRDGGGAVSTFDLVGEGVKANGDPVPVTLAKLTPTPSGETTVELVREAETLMANEELLLFTGTLTPETGMFLKVGEGDLTSELIMLDAYDEDTEVWTVARAMFDTVMRVWPIGTRVWYLGDFLIPVDPTEQNDGEETVYHLLPTSAGGKLAYADSDPYPFTPTARPYQPIRPANVEVEPSALGASMAEYEIEVQNPGAETHATLVPTIWTCVKVSTDTSESDGDGGEVLPHTGARFFKFGGTVGDDASMEQTLSIPGALDDHVDAGDLTLQVPFYIAGRNPAHDPVNVEVEFYDAADTLLDTITSEDFFPVGLPTAGLWTLKEPTFAVPATARYYVLRFLAFDTGPTGASTHTYVDTISVRWLKEGFPIFGFSGTEIPADLNLSWSNRNRLSEDTLAPRWTEATVTPEVGQTTTVRVRERFSQSVEFEETGITGTTYALDLSVLTDFRLYDLEILSERDGFESIQWITIPVEIVGLGYGNNYGYDYGENDG